MQGRGYDVTAYFFQYNDIVTYGFVAKKTQEIGSIAIKNSFFDVPFAPLPGCASFKVWEQIYQGFDITMKIQVW
jgi:hypothetical protein